MLSCIRSPKRPSQSSHPDRNFAIGGPTLPVTTVQLKLRWGGGRSRMCALPCAHVSAPRGAAFSGDVSAVRTGRRHALHGGHEARRGQGFSALPGMPPRMADRNADESGDGSGIDHARLAVQTCREAEASRRWEGKMSLPRVGGERCCPPLLQACCQDYWPGTVDRCRV